MLREEIDERYNSWYSEILKFAEKLSCEEKMKRAKGKIIHRATHPSETPKDYYKRSIVIPFIDDVSSQLTDRFPDDTSVLRQLMSLIPNIISDCSVPDLSSISESLTKWYDEDLPQPSSLQNELQIWRGRWIRKMSTDHAIPITLIDSLNRCSKDNFPNIYRLLQISCLIPVTSCEAERSFSAVRRHKTPMRSTMADGRPTSLVLMNVNDTFELDIDEIMERFIKKHPRRLFSPLYLDS
ncbi:hypothetical protein SNE40_023059 [Patella caerulea]|uniref:HAT C-terminal dimerisation domain-containing protein n=1 Tax=Patella caerulea TaxID=87958 RepID=A0AAN8IY94_PATCE